MKGSEVKAIRKRLRLTQTAFADLVGVHSITVSRWERDAVAIPPDTVVARLLPLRAAAKRGRKR